MGLLGQGRFALGDGCVRWVYWDSKRGRQATHESLRIRDVKITMMPSSPAPCLALLQSARVWVGRFIAFLAPLHHACLARLLRQASRDAVATVRTRAVRSCTIRSKVNAIVLPRARCRGNCTLQLCVAIRQNVRHKMFDTKCSTHNVRHDPTQNVRHDSTQQVDTKRSTRCDTMY